MPCGSQKSEKNLLTGSRQQRQQWLKQPPVTTKVCAIPSLNVDDGECGRFFSLNTLGSLVSAEHRLHTTAYQNIDVEMSISL